MNASARSSIAKVMSPPSPSAEVRAAGVIAERGQDLVAQGARQLQHQLARGSRVRSSDPAGRAGR